MTLALADLRTLAWRTFDCDSCGELAGHRCIAQPSGARTTPHAARLTMARGYDARQPEVDALQQALNLRDATISDDEDELRRITTERDGLKTDLAAANLEVTQQGEQIAALTSDLAVTRAEFAAWVKAHPDTPPTEPPTKPTATLTFGVGVDVLGDLETRAGKPVGYHRTYWTLPASGVHASAVAQVKADLAAGRTPVMSFKLPGKSLDFAGAAAGKFDAPVKATVAALAALDAPMIMIIQHEPENDGVPIADYVAMTKHFVPLVRVGKVQFWQGLEGYPQVDKSNTTWSLSNVYVPGVDGIGFDPYLSFGAKAGNTKWTDQTVAYYKPFGDFAKAHGIAWGIFETGMNEQAAASGLPQAASFVADCVAGAKANGATCWIWFGSETNKDGKHNWKLTTTGANKAAQMAAVVAKYAR